jgi:hypothetical protein
MLAEVEEVLERFRECDELGYALQMWDYALRTASRLSSTWSGDTDVEFICTGADQLPFPDRRFHLIIARLVLPYVDVPAVLDEFARVSAERSVWLVQTHSFRYYVAQVLAHPRSFAKVMYYLRPILSGGVFRLTGWQSRQRWWHEIALSSRHLIEQCRRRGVECFWQNEQAAVGRPLLALRTRGSYSGAASEA